MRRKLDRLIAIDRLTEGAANGFNEPTETWTQLCQEWAEKRDVSDGEKTNAGMTYSARVARFTVRSNATTRTVTSDDRLSYDGTWNILGVKEIDRNRYLEITAERRSD